MRIVIADDHRIVRDGLRLILAHDPDITVVGEAADGAGLLELVAANEVDVVLLDIKMPGVSGLDVLQRLGEGGSPVRVVVLSMYDDPVYVERAIELGAAGYLLKSVNREELLRALHTVATGGSYIQGEIAGRLIARMVSGGTEQSATSLGVEERRLLEYLAAGYGNEAIGAAMHLTSSAVKARLHGLYLTLGVKRRSEAVAVGIRMGLVS